MKVSGVVGRVVSASAAVVLCCGLMSCSTMSGAGGPSVSGSPASASTLTVATSFAVDDLDPLENGFWGNELGYSELLMRPRVGGAVTPWLLRSLTNTSPTTWVLTLHSGITFQDGAPLDAAALVSCMSYQLKKNSSAIAALPGATVTATGTDQVTLTTTSPVPDVPYILGDEAFFVIYDQAAYLAAKGHPAKLIAARLYTGPYVVTSNTPQVMKMVRNPIYWDGTPALSGVTVKFISDASARILAVQHGEADLALYPPTTAAKTLKTRNDSFFVSGTPHGPTFDLFLNQHTAPFNDTAVRKAVLAGINYDQLANQVMDKLYEPATGMYDPAAPYAVATQKTNTARATALLDDDGWKLGPSGVRSKDGASLSFTLLTYPQQPDSVTLAVAVQAQLKAIGIAVKISQVPDTEAVMSNPTGWQAGVIGDGTTSFSGDPIPTLQNYYAGTGSYNYGGIHNSTLDALIAQLAVTVDPAEANRILRQTQQIIADNGYMGFLGQRLPAVIASPAWKKYPVPAANLWVNATTAPTS